MSNPKPQSKKKAKAISRSHGAGGVAGSLEPGGAANLELGKTGPTSKPVIAPQPNEWFSKRQWGTHKYKGNWQDVLREAKSKWEQPEQDWLIADAHKTSPLPPDEIEAAVKWECFRHLYFSGQLSDFWKEMIEGNQIEALEKHYPNSIKKISAMFGHGPRDFGSPWATWANTQCFPACPWMKAREETTFDKFRSASEMPPDGATLLADGLTTWSLAFYWAQAKIEESHQLLASNPELFSANNKAGINEPAEIPCTGELPKRARSENISRVILEIDWDLPKTAIVQAFQNQIEPLWQKRNPNGKQGRKDTESPFFSGLAIHRRVNRGITEYDACEGLYETRTDTKSGLTLAAKNALSLAQTRLAETKSALDAIEDKLKQS